LPAGRGQRIVVKLRFTAPNALFLYVPRILAGPGRR
jgi:hypothetical protein